MIYNRIGHDNNHRLYYPGNKKILYSCFFSFVSEVCFQIKNPVHTAELDSGLITCSLKNNPEQINKTLKKVLFISVPLSSGLRDKRKLINEP